MPEAKPRTVRIYQDANGREPFGEWMDTILGQKIHGIVLTRIDRVRQGNFGDHHSVGQGVSELVIDFGPGYRVYYGHDGDELVILLGGGPKGTQTKNIADAQEFWRDYNA